jgi:hypothetical protein
MASDIQEEKPDFVMITGQQDISIEDFQTYYEPAIEAMIKQKVHFVIGNAEGVDKLAKEFLHMYSYHSVTIFDKASGDGGVPWGARWRVVNGFKSYPERDLAMIEVSNKIICYLFGAGALGSGTYRNLVTFFTLKGCPVPVNHDDMCIHLRSLFQLNRMYQRGTVHSSKSWEIDIPEDWLFPSLVVSSQKE